MSERLTDEQVREEAAYALGIQACLWGRPLMENEVTIARALKAGGAGVNGFRHFDNLKTAADRFVVTPNNVSIDSYGLADLRIEPVVISVPAIAEDRWTIVQIGDHYDEIVENVGGYRGNEPGLYLVSGPDYHGRVPLGMRHIPVRTRLCSVAVRVMVRGEADLPAARGAQRGFAMMPLSTFERYGLTYVDPGGSQVGLIPAFEPSGPEELRTLEHIGFAMTVELSPSLDSSDPLVQAFHGIGLSVAHGFEWETRDDATKRGLARAIPVAEQIIDHAYFGAATTVDGWRYTFATGRAGYDLAARAAFAKYLIGANVPEQLVYPNTAVDRDGEPLSGGHRYELRFEAGQTPPVSVLWNMSMYDPGMLFIENDFGRFSIGSTTDGIATAEDGSLTILIQHERPDDTSNWLPAPATGPFNLTMRMYGAQTAVLDGSYRLPPITRTS